jgi:hypothetical protein
MAREGAWPQREPILASYDNCDVIEYLETFLEALTALVRLLERSSGGPEIAIPEGPSVRREWIEALPAQLATQADWVRASVAYVQLLESLEDFAGPFGEFLRRAAELGSIPHVDIEFDEWVLKCTMLCLRESGVPIVREVGSTFKVELGGGARRSMVVAVVLLQGYRDRLAAKDEC